VNEAELRALIRESVARHLGDSRGEATRPFLPPARAGASAVHAGPSGSHPSQVIYVTLTSAGEACLIEPAVTCTHCGYCKTHGY
jgi:hypothetical protein